MCESHRKWPLKLTLAEDYTVKLLIYQGRQSIIYK